MTGTVCNQMAKTATAHRCLLRGFLFCLVAVVLLAGSITVGKARTAPLSITVVVNNAPPYRIIDENISPPVYSGMYIDVIEDAARRAGFDIHYRNVPFRRALYLMQAGDADVMLGPNKTPDRATFMYFLKTPLPAETKAVYVADGAADIRKLSDLENRTVGVLRGASYNPRFDAASDIDRFGAADYLTLFRMLEQHRIDAVIVPAVLARYLLHREPHAVHPASLTFAGKPSYIAVSRQSRFFQQGNHIALEHALGQMQRDGSLRRIFQLYE